MARVRLTEIFHSIQGEGETVGLPTTFVRLTGCSLRCSWCDTTYSFHGGKEADTEDIARELRSRNVRRVCITGGEPLDQHDSAMALMDELLRSGIAVVLETSGSIALSSVDKLEPRTALQISMDVKCPSSNMQKRNLWENLRVLRAHDQLKFVISDRRDFDYALQVLADHAPINSNLLFQPMWASPNPVSDVKFHGEPATLRMLADWVLQAGIDARVGTQLHKLIWGYEMGR